MSDRILLDTQVFLWLINDDARLTRSAKEVFLHSDSQPLLSLASIWEIFVKCRTGKLELGGDPSGFLRRQLDENRIDLLPIRFEHTARTLLLPLHHRDPFDRLIIAQALHEGIPVLSADSSFSAYGVTNLF